MVTINLKVSMCGDIIANAKAFIVKHLLLTLVILVILMSQCNTYTLYGLRN